MSDKYEHYITKNIRAFYIRRLFSPLIFLLLLAALWFLLPLQDMLSPAQYPANASLESMYLSGDSYVRTTLTDLTFTGYSLKKHNNNAGYYYYGLRNGECIIVLLNPATCEEGLPSISSITVTGKVIQNDDSLTPLFELLAEDLDWTTDGIYRQMGGYYFSEPDYNRVFTTILFVVYFGTMAYACICLIAYLLYARFPVLSPPCQNLVVFGRPKQMLEEAEEELATLPQLATEDMFITEHYFIMTSPYGNAFVPIQEILWIYKHSTLHKFLWYHFSISYTMHITANKHLYFHCPKNIKSDIDGIMDYLAEANHHILVGFSEENRLKVEKVLGKPFHMEKLYALLRRKI